MFQLIITILVALSLLAGGSLAVQAAGPGDLLYGLDRSFEQARLMITTNPEKEVALRLQYATERLEETEQKLSKGKIENALTALGSYDNALSEVAELIGNEDGQNREALRSMAQEELALQQGTLDRIRLSQPEDAQARNAFQYALQRANMGVDKLLGPPETAPQGPAENMPQGPSQGDGNGPDQDVPQGPNQEAPQGPNQEEPCGPAEDAPCSSPEDAPQGPSDDHPQEPSHDAPHGPTEDAPQGKH